MEISLYRLYWVTLGKKRSFFVFVTKSNIYINSVIFASVIKFCAFFLCFIRNFKLIIINLVTCVLCKYHENNCDKFL